MYILLDLYVSKYVCIICSLTLIFCSLVVAQQLCGKKELYNIHPSYDMCPVDGELFYYNTGLFSSNVMFC